MDTSELAPEPANEATPMKAASRSCGVKAASLVKAVTLKLAKAKKAVVKKPAVVATPVAAVSAPELAKEATPKETPGPKATRGCRGANVVSPVKVATLKPAKCNKTASKKQAVASTSVATGFAPEPAIGAIRKKTATPKAVNGKKAVAKNLLLYASVLEKGIKL